MLVDHSGSFLLYSVKNLICCRRRGENEGFSSRCNWNSGKLLTVVLNIILYLYALKYYAMSFVFQFI